MCAISPPLAQARESSGTVPNGVNSGAMAGKFRLGRVLSRRVPDFLPKTSRLAVEQHCEGGGSDPIYPAREPLVRTSCPET